MVDGSNGGRDDAGGEIEIERLEEEFDSSGTGASFDAIVKKFTELISLLFKQLLSEEFGATVDKIKSAGKYLKLGAILLVVGILMLGVFMMVWFFVGITYIATNTMLPEAVAPFIVGIFVGIVVTIIFRVLR
ncbi:MAG: hypothetical protein ABEK59_12875 [Halobacteria archaeon]